MKNDAFGEHFGSKPSWLPYGVGARNACREIAGIERRAMAAGVGPGRRATTPLFGPQVGVEWHHSLVDAMFQFLLRVGCGLDADKAMSFSMHSFRIYLACALYAAKCPNDKIMAILRWRSDEALSIYARMNDDERTSWVAAAQSQKVNSVSAAHLPRIDPDSYVAAIRASHLSGELGRVARMADADVDMDSHELDDVVQARECAEDVEEVERAAARQTNAAARRIAAAAGLVPPPPVADSLDA